MCFGESDHVHSDFAETIANTDYATRSKGESYTTEKVGGQLSSGKDSSNLDRKPTESNAALVVIDPLFKEMLPAAAVQQSLLPLVVHTQLLPHLFCGDGFPLPLLTFARSSATERISRSDCDEGYVFVKSCEP